MAQLTPAFLTSLILHFLLAGMLLIGLPLYPKNLAREERVITFELVEIKEIDNIKTEIATPKNQENLNPTKLETNNEEIAQKAEKNTIKPTMPLLSELTPSLQQKPLPQEEKANSDQINNDKVKNLVKELTQQQIKTPPTIKSKQEVGKVNAKGNNFDQSKILSISLKNYIRNIISQYWRKPPGSELIAGIQITAKINLNRAGEIKQINITKSTCPANKASLCKLVENSIYRTLKQIDIIENLPAAKYSEWKEFSLLFDPSNF